MNHVYIHVAMMGNFEKIFTELSQSINLSELSVNSTINVGIVGGNIGSLNTPWNKFSSGNISDFEFKTLSKMQQHAKLSENDYYLYIHTKGVSTPDNPAIDDWRKYMTYFCVEKWKDCINKLNEGADCVGVDWRTDPVPHYSGNFWWASGKHLSKLPDILALGQPGAPHVLSVRHNAEFWIGMKPETKSVSLWDCGINQYSRHLHRYQKENYANG